MASQQFNTKKCAPHYIFFGLSRIRKTKVNDSTKINAILNLKLDKIRENCKASQQFNNKICAHTGFFWSLAIRKTQVNDSTKICAILEL